MKTSRVTITDASEKAAEATKVAGIATVQLGLVILVQLLLMGKPFQFST